MESVIILQILLVLQELPYPMLQDLAEDQLLGVVTD
jgi:hypothetical protein